MSEPAKVGAADPGPKKPSMSVTTMVSTAETLHLALIIDDPEVIVELTKFEEGTARNAFAQSALRIGILALRQARGQVDAASVRNEGEHLLAGLKHELEARVGQMETTLATTLKQYFDPQSGHFTERVERLIRKDGDLERVLQEQIGDGESSALARALARRIGENSPLMKRLNPEDAEGVTAAIEGSVKEILYQEQVRLLREFSLRQPR
jgi:hypothetical protein